ncbi:hypothetical protein EV356DRAFT_502042 [Viridothelium virens]|uniref:Aminoglycoside phosphotransferase domain-containing protein n=1 Tax=Viridothelium virens TaxID=1048519 RepID=A0A6A6HLW2_VIRVR|nr:hypothetical protein EV356DRAFT_502042 [Viridothelium virens]
MEQVLHRRPKDSQPPPSYEPELASVEDHGEAPDDASSHEDELPPNGTKRAPLGDHNKATDDQTVHDNELPSSGSKQSPFNGRAKTPNGMTEHNDKLPSCESQDAPVNGHGEVGNGEAEDYYVIPSSTEARDIAHIPINGTVDATDGGSDDEEDYKDSRGLTSETLLRGQEPFTTYKEKIHRLVTDLGATEIESVERIKGGSYNRIAAITARFGEQKSTTKAVFRITRSAYVSWSQELKEKKIFEQENDILDHAAIHAALTGRGIPVPRILAYDATHSNVIEAPFTLQQFAYGTRLDHIFDEMTVDEKLSIAGQIANLLGQMEFVRFEGAGTVHHGVSRSRAHSRYPLKMNVFDPIPDDLAEKLKFTTSVGEGHGRKNDRRIDGAYEYIVDAVNFRISEEYEAVEPSLELMVLERTKEIVEQMKDTGIFNFHDDPYPQPNVLYHWDLEPRNILVKRTHPSGKVWEISAIVDWDGARAVPPVLARRPPAWLWDKCKSDRSSSVYSFDDDWDNMPLNRYADDSDKITEEGHCIKNHFYNCFVKKMALHYPGYSKSRYLDEAYGRGRVIRRILPFTYCSSGRYNEYWERFAQLSKEWSEAHPYFSVIHREELGWFEKGHDT